MQLIFAIASVLLGVFLFVFHFFVNAEVREAIFRRRDNEQYAPNEPAERRKSVSEMQILGPEPTKMEWDYGASDLFGEVCVRMPSSDILNFRRIGDGAGVAETSMRSRRISAVRQPDPGRDGAIGASVKRKNPLYTQDHLELGGPRHIPVKRGSEEDGSRTSAGYIDVGSPDEV